MLPQYDLVRPGPSTVLPISSRREALDWVVIDIAQWRIHVLDCNRACVQDEKLEALLQPFVVLMPFLIRLNGGEALNEAATESPLQITRLDLPICCEPTGMFTPFYLQKQYRIQK